MLIECKTYNLEEFKKIFKISKRRWEESKEEVLKYISYFCDYTITMKGRAYIIEIKQQFADYVPIPRKTQIPEIKQYYKEEACEMARKKPFNTAASLSRNIYAEKGKGKYNHEQSTQEKYIGEAVKENLYCPYGIEKEWGYLSKDRLTWTPLTDKEVEELYQMFEKENRSISKDEFNLIGDFKSGLITKEQAVDKLFDIKNSSYVNTLKKFRDKYNKWPYKVPYLMEYYDFTDPNKEIMYNNKNKSQSIEPLKDFIWGIEDDG